MLVKLAQKTWLESNKVDLRLQLSLNKLPHGLLMIGSHGAGQQELSKWLADALLCQHQSNQENPCGNCKSCSLLQAMSHPDFQHIDNGDKTIGVELIRKASEFLQKTAQLGHNKVVLINACENMTESAANALLKTLEEPSNNSYLILACNDTNLLLPTIVSRCSQILVRPPVGENLAELVADKTLLNDFSNISQFAELADPEITQQYIDFNQSLLNWLLDCTDDNGLIEVLSKNLHGFRWFSQCFNQFIRIKSTWLETNDELTKQVIARYSTETFWSCQSKINQTSKQLKTLTQVNKSFVIEALLVDLEHILINE